MKCVVCPTCWKRDFFLHVFNQATHNDRRERTTYKASLLLFVPPPRFFLYLLKKIWWWDWNRLCIYKQINVGDAELCVYSVEFEKDSLTIICSPTFLESFSTLFLGQNVIRCILIARLFLIFPIIKTTSSIISQTDITAACAPTDRNQLHSSYISYYMYI